MKIDEPAQMDSLEQDVTKVESSQKQDENEEEIYTETTLKQRLDEKAMVMARGSVKKRLILMNLYRGPKKPGVLAFEITEYKGIPVFHRSKIYFHLRDLVAVGLVENNNGVYQLTELGKKICDEELVVK